jgi:ketosteroid isomerase-like protein
MTYPPQPPGPPPPQGPYGQQPGPYGQQPPPGYGQQPPPGYPPQQPYGYGPPPPKKSRTGLVIGVIAGVVVLAGGAIAAFLVFSGGGAKSAAEEYAAAVSARDESKYMSMLCPEIRSEVQKSLDAATKDPRAKEELEKIKQNSKTNVSVKNVTESGDSADVIFHIDGNLGDQKVNQDVTYTFKKSGDAWQLCDQRYLTGG